MKWNKIIKFLMLVLIIATFLMELRNGISVGVKFKGYENEKYSSFVTAKVKEGYADDDLSMFMNDADEETDEMLMDLPPIDKDKSANKEKKSEIQKLNNVNKNGAEINKLNKQSQSKENKMKKEISVRAKPARLEEKSKLISEDKIPKLNPMTANVSKDSSNSEAKKSVKSSSIEPTKSKFIPKINFSSVINKIKFKSRRGNLEEPIKEKKDQPIFDAKKEIDRIKNENINKEKPKELDQLKSKEVNSANNFINSAKKDSENQTNVENKKINSETKPYAVPNANVEINKKLSSSISPIKPISELSNNNQINQPEKSNVIKNEINNTTIQQASNTNKLTDNKIPTAISNMSPSKETNDNAGLINHALNIDTKKNDKPKANNNPVRKKSPFLNFIQTKNYKNDLTGEDSETPSVNADKNNQNTNMNKIENTLDKLTEPQGKPIINNINSNPVGIDMRSSYNTNPNRINNLSSNPKFSSQNLNDNNNNNYNNNNNNNNNSNNSNINPLYNGNSENFKLFSQLDSGFVQNLIKIQNDPDVQNILAKKKDFSYNTYDNNNQYMMNNNQRNSNQDSLRQREKINRNLYKNYYKPDAIDLSKLNYINNLIGNVK